MNGAPVLSAKSGSSAPYRILIAKAGMDGHDRGARVVARALRDAGMEVIYTGRHVSIEFIAQSAVQEDVDVVGLSILSGAHLALTRQLIDRLDELGVKDEVAVVVGGTISTLADRDLLLSMGAADVYPGGTALPDLVTRVEAVAAARRDRLANPT